MSQSSPTAEILEQEQVESVQRMLAFQQEVTQVNAKALMTALTHKKGNAILVGMVRLRVMPDFNPRINTPALAAHIRSIADSMKEVGFKESKPLSCVSGFEGKRSVIYIADGHCRFEAAKLAISEGASIEWIPIVLEDRTTTIEDLTVSLVRSNSGKPLTVLEMAIVVKRLHNFRQSARTIAERIGVTEAYVNMLLTVSGAPSEIRRMIQEGEITAGVALESMRAHGPQATAVLTQAVTLAKQNGKTKVTRAALPAQVYRKAITRQAPAMVEVVRRVTQHQAFAALPDELREDIRKILDEVDQAQAQMDQTQRADVAEEAAETMP